MTQGVLPVLQCLNPEPDNAAQTANPTSRMDAVSPVLECSVKFRPHKALAPPVIPCCDHDRCNVQGLWGVLWQGYC